MLICGWVVSLPERGSIGDRLFSGGWQLTLMKRMKKRLMESADHYQHLTSMSQQSNVDPPRRQLYEKLDRYVTPTLTHSLSLHSRMN